MSRVGLLSTPHTQNPGHGVGQRIKTSGVRDLPVRHGKHAIPHEFKRSGSLGIGKITMRIVVELSALALQIKALLPYKVSVAAIFVRKQTSATRQLHPFVVLETPEPLPAESLGQTKEHSRSNLEGRGGIWIDQLGRPQEMLSAAIRITQAGKLSELFRS